MKILIDEGAVRALKDLAMTAAAADVFKGLGYDTAQGTDALNARAFMTLLAASELGLSFVDALNRVRFTEQGLTFAPAVDKTFDDVLRQNVAEAQKEERKEAAKAVKREEPATITGVTKEEAQARIPKGFTPEGKLMVECSIGELGYYLDEATKKGHGVGLRAVAWKVLSAKIPTASALELGKFTRWITNPKYPDLRVFFADALVAAEARIEELGTPQ